MVWPVIQMTGDMKPKNPGKAFFITQRATLALGPGIFAGSPNGNRGPTFIPFQRPTASSVRKKMALRSNG